jgi:hypothetical protein
MAAASKDQSVKEWLEGVDVVRRAVGELGAPKLAAVEVVPQEGEGVAREQRGEGQPEAGPLPGQPDLSKPQIVLPPDVQDLLDSLSPRELRRLRNKPGELRRKLEEVAPPQAPAPPLDNQTTGQLLDYLLAP